MSLRAPGWALTLTLTLILALCVFASPVAASDLDEIVEPLLKLWQEADLVCLGEEHGDLDDHALRMALVRHPDFAATVQVVIAELVNPMHQALLDRWLVDGEEVPNEQLQRVWRDAGLSPLWDLPIYAGFLSAIRDLNRGLPATLRVRVVGGGPPIPWPEVREPKDLLPWLDRTRFFLDTARREVLVPGRKGLAIFGAGHCERSGMGFPARLTSQEKARVRSVQGFQGAVGRQAAQKRLRVGPGPEWIRVRGTELAQQGTGKLLFEGHAYSGAQLGDLVDALVYFPPRGKSGVTRQKVDASFTRELERRRLLMQQAQESSTLRQFE